MTAMAKKEIDIEALLVWAYQVQCVDKLRLQTFSQAAPMDSCRRLELAVADGGGNVGVDCHPDAEAVHFAVLRLSKAQQALVIGNAKIGTRPDWMPGARFVMAAVVTSNGNPKKLYDANRNCIGHAVAPALEQVDGSICYAPIDPRTPAPTWFSDVIELHRLQYKAWIEALSALVLHLNEGAWLSDHHATGPIAPLEPWNADPRISSNPC